MKIALRCGLAALLFGPLSTGPGAAPPQSPDLPGMVRVTGRWIASQDGAARLQVESWEVR